MGDAIFGEQVNGSRHFKHFKRLHRTSMALAQIEQPRFTKPIGNGASSAATVLHEALQLPRPWWTQLFKWERNLTVAGRTIEKGWVIPQSLGVALIVLILSGIGTIYWTMSARIDAKDNAYQQQRDMLIRLDTQLQERDKREQEFRMERKNADDLQELKIQDLKDKLLVINTKRGN